MAIEDKNPYTTKSIVHIYSSFPMNYSKSFYKEGNRLDVNAFRAEPFFTHKFMENARSMIVSVY
jgi:hypothetical protein